MDHASHTGFGRMVFLQATRDRALVELCRSLVRDQPVGHLEPIATPAIELGPEHGGTALGREHPGAQDDGRCVPDVLAVAADQLGDPGVARK